MESKSQTADESIPESVDDDISLVVTCPLCQEIMLKPKLLPCLHNMCRECLQIHINKTGKERIDAGQGFSSFPCPVCEEELHPLKYFEDRPPPERWANLFPSNLFLNNLSLLCSVQQGGKQCDPCGRRGVTSKARWWCRDCVEFQCNVCNTVHGGFQNFEDHYVCNISELKHDRVNALPRREPCREHKQNVTMYCRIHHLPCCSICVSNSHKKCVKVVPISEEFRRLEEMEELPRLVSTLSEYEVNASEIITERSRIAYRIRERKGEILSQIKTIRKEFEDAMDRLEERLVSKFTESFEEEIEKLEELNKQGENFIKQLTNAIQLLQCVNQNGCDSQVIGLKTKVTNRCKHYEEELRKLERMSIVENYGITVDKDIEDVIKTATSLGKVVVQRTTGKRYSIASDPYSYNKKGVAKELYRVRIWQADDIHRCYILGGVFMRDGRVLLADFDNYKVKLFSKEGRLLRSLRLKSKPSDIAMINDVTFAVTLPQTNHLQLILQTGKEMSSGRSIQLPMPAHSLSCYGSKLYLASNDDISVCNSDGSNMEAIRLQDKGVPSVFTPGYIKVSKNGMYLTDNKNNMVTCYTFTGELLFIHTAKNMKHPMGLDVDTFGNVYICCRKSSNVFQMSGEGSRVNELLSVKEFLANPLTIVFQQGTRNRFFISESTAENKDFIKFFELV